MKKFLFVLLLVNSVTYSTEVETETYDVDPATGEPLAESFVLDMGHFELDNLNPKSAQQQSSEEDSSQNSTDWELEHNNLRKNFDAQLEENKRLREQNESLAKQIRRLELDVEASRATELVDFKSNVQTFEAGTQTDSEYKEQHEQVVEDNGSEELTASHELAEELRKLTEQNKALLETNARLQIVVDQHEAHKEASKKTKSKPWYSCLPCCS